MKNKRFLSILVSLVLVFSLVVMTVVADGFYTPEELDVENETLYEHRVNCCYEKIEVEVYVDGAIKILTCCDYCDLELTIALSFEDFGIDPNTLEGAVVIKIPTYGEPIIFYSFEEYEAHTNPLKKAMFES